MYRRIDDFLAEWASESNATQSVLRNLTDRSLGQRVTPDGRSLAKLAWHLAQSIQMGTEAGLTGVAGPGEHDPVPANAQALLEGYTAAAQSLPQAVKAEWTDALLGEAVPMYGEMWPRGKVLDVIIRHEAHHRGQMTVLMRQAGLTVPGVYGPAREEWAAMGMEAQD